MFKLIDLSALDECQCGDYRRDHEEGTGRCRMSDDGCHGFRPCRRFRMVSSPDVSQAREQRRLDAQALLQQKYVIHRINGVVDKIRVEFSEIEWHQIEKITEGE